MAADAVLWPRQVGGHIGSSCNGAPRGRVQGAVLPPRHWGLKWSESGVSDHLWREVLGRSTGCCHWLVAAPATQYKSRSAAYTVGCSAC
jgi:hypothetical protein